MIRSSLFLNRGHQLSKDVSRCAVPCINGYPIPCHRAKVCASSGSQSRSLLPSNPLRMFKTAATNPNPNSNPNPIHKYALGRDDHWRRNMKLIVNTNFLRQQSRSYIFFEKDFIQSILDSISNKEQKLRKARGKRKKEIIVTLRNTRNEWKHRRQKFVSKVKSKVKHKRDRLKMYYSQPRYHIEKTIDDYKSRHRHRYMYKYIKDVKNRVRKKAKEARHGSITKWDSLVSKSKGIKQRWRKRYSNSIAETSTKAVYPYMHQTVTIDEPFQKEWFRQPGGYPLTSKDPKTGRYCNPWNSQSTNGFKRLGEVWRWKKTRFTESFLDTPTSNNQTKNDFNWNVTTEQREEMKAKACIPTPGEIQLTWIGHATCLVHFSDEFKVLTDPVFSHKASPFQMFDRTEFLGVPRLFPPSLSIDDVGAIGGVDACVISHDHYDHLDIGSIQELTRKNLVKYWAVPMGTKEWFLTNIDGIDEDSVVELEWWQSITLVKCNKDGNMLRIKGGISQVLETTMVNDGLPNSDSESSGYPYYSDPRSSELTLTCAPAQHWCSRTPFDRNTRLWCSWAIHSQIKSVDEENHSNPHTKNAEYTDIPSRDNLSFYFAGDTGYPQTFPLHRQIGDILGPFDLASIPIGAYKPRFFMQDSHCDPQEAVEIHKDVRSKRSVAIHWGTFPLANESFQEPPNLLHETAGRQDDVDFVAIPHGDSIVSDSNSIKPLPLSELGSGRKSNL